MNQTEAVLRHLRHRGSITPLQALQDYGIFRLAARVAELRSAGHDIETATVRLPSGKEIAQYRLIEPETQIGAGL